MCKWHCEENEKTSTKWEKIFAKDLLSRLLSKNTWRTLAINNKKRKNPIKKQANSLSRCLTKEDIQIENKDMKKCPTSNVIKELYIFKQQRDTTIYLLELWKSQTLTTPMEQQELFFVACDSLAESYKSKHSLNIWSGSCTPWYLPKQKMSIEKYARECL